MLKHNFSLSLLIVAFSLPTILMKGAEEGKSEEKAGSYLIQLPNKIDQGFLMRNKEPLKNYSDYDPEAYTQEEINEDLLNVNSILPSWPTMAVRKEEARIKIAETVRKLHDRYRLRCFKAESRRYALLSGIANVCKVLRRLDSVAHNSLKHTVK